MGGTIVARQCALYREAVLRHGDSPQGTLQNDRETQFTRFERLFRNILPIEEGATVHDVGCGFADLHGYLLEREIFHVYSGSEIVPEMVARTREKYPEITVYERDFLGTPEGEQYDYVVLNGVFNVPGGADHGEWKRFCERMIETMYARARRAVAFNFLSSHRTFSDDRLYYMDPGGVLDFCRTHLSRFATVDHAYPLYEATITVFRPEAIRAAFPGEVFMRYLR